MKILIVFLIASLFFLIPKVLRLGIKRLLNRYTGLNFMNNLIVAAEFSLWLTFAFWALYFLFRDKFYYPYLIYAMIIIVAGLLSWFLLRDIFAGIIFRIKHNLKSGSYIRTGDLSGMIKSQQITYLKIMTDDGQHLRIPYSRIINEVITELAYRGTREQHIIRLLVDKSLDRSKAESLIRIAILNSPWTNIKDEPSIRFLDANDKGHIFEITLLSKNINQMKPIEMAMAEIPLFQVVAKNSNSLL